MAGNPKYLSSEAAARGITSPWVPVIICCSLISVPYLIFSWSRYTPISKVATVFEHVLVSTIVVSIIILASAIAVRAGKSVSGGAVSRNLLNVLWLVVFASIIANCILVVTSGGAYIVGGFIAARASFAFDGLGAIIRTYMLALPLLLVYAKNRRLIWSIVAIIALFSIARAVIMSERLAIIEFIATMWVAAVAGSYRISLKQVLMVTAAAIIAFGAIAVTRYDQQRDQNIRISPAQIILGSFIPYYTDTQNKFYLSLRGDFRYPKKFTLAPIDAFASKPSSTGFLAYWSVRSSAIIKWLTNPGGLTSLVSDFGVVGGAVALAAVFGASGFIISNSRYAGPSAILAPLFVVSIVDFPRHLYIALPMSAYIVALGILLIAFNYSGIRKRGGVGLRHPS